MRKRPYFETSSKRDSIDAMTALDFTAMATRCPGGRIILKGYVCIHCGHDQSVGPEYCGAPVGQNGTTIIKRKDKFVEDE